MKKPLLIALSCLALFSGCKKSDAVKPIDHLTQLKSEVLGNWYYNSLTLGFYENSVTDVYDEVATPTDLRNEPYFIFNKDFTGRYVDPVDNTQTVQFSYRVTSTNNADSLICSGGISARFDISLITDYQMDISQSIYQDKNVLDVQGKVVATNLTRLTASLVRNPVH